MQEPGGVAGAPLALEAVAAAPAVAAVAPQLRSARSPSARTAARAQSQQPRPLLFNAIAANSLSSVQMLLREGADVNVTADGFTPLHAAAGRFVRNVQIMQLLVDSNANVHAVDQCGDTPLTCLLWRSSRSAGDQTTAWEQQLAVGVELLLQAGATVSAKALAAAAALAAPQYFQQQQQQGERLLQKLLAAAGGAIETDSYGCTALHFAVKQMDVCAVQVLINNNANVDATDQVGDTPLTQLVWGLCQQASATVRLGLNKPDNLPQAKRIAQLLLQAGAEVGPKALAAAAQLLVLQQQQQQHAGAAVGSSGTNALLQQLVAAAAGGIDAAGSKGETALHIAVSFTWVGAVELLLAHGASVAAQRRGFRSMNVLHEAVLKYHNALAHPEEYVKLVKLLAAAAAQSGCLDAPDAEGETALVYAVRIEPEHTAVEVVRNLLEAGADPNHLCRATFSVRARLPVAAAAAAAAAGQEADFYAPAAAAAAPAAAAAAQVVAPAAAAGVVPPPPPAAEAAAAAAAVAPAAAAAGATHLPAAAAADNLQKSEYTALDVAAQRGRIEVVRVLLQAGARSAAAGVTGHPTLSLVCRVYNVGMVKLLLSNMHDQPTVAQVTAAIKLWSCSWIRDVQDVNAVSHLILAQLLLHLHRTAYSVTEAVRHLPLQTGSSACALRLALLRGWAADTAAADAEHEAHAASEKAAAVMKRDAQQALLGLAHTGQQPAASTNGFAARAGCEHKVGAAAEREAARLLL